MDSVSILRNHFTQTFEWQRDHSNLQIHYIVFHLKAFAEFFFHSLSSINCVGSWVCLTSSSFPGAVGLPLQSLLLRTVSLFSLGFPLAKCLISLVCLHEEQRFLNRAYSRSINKIRWRLFASYNCPDGKQFLKSILGM